LIRELAENGEGDQTIMDIAGHVSKQMLARCGHIRMDAKRKALESVSMKSVVSNAESEASPGQSASAKGNRLQNWAQSSYWRGKVDSEIVDLIGSNSRNLPALA
jgi:hypothetical protein